MNPNLLSGSVTVSASSLRSGAGDASAAASCDKSDGFFLIMSAPDSHQHVSSACFGEWQRINPVLTHLVLTGLLGGIRI